ncbi:cupin domain-containing protein [Peristeroidobacter agariperforans]|uniref:cupin domain-containing protein n=1 Tax=Peristeroidobacter agariperforans TaxID=268404 RepID=UPI00101CD415|nr:cupin domain-containing protein [Peristeroidobacter agariperforans]
MILNRNATRTWSETGLDGIVSCAIWTGNDGDGGYLAKLAAGARFPRGRHQGWEQIVVLSGAVLFNDTELRTGDVLQVDGDDEHEALALEDAVLFVAHHRGIVFTRGLDRQGSNEPR